MKTACKEHAQRMYNHSRGFTQCMDVISSLFISNLIHEMDTRTTTRGAARGSRTATAASNDHTGFIQRILYPNPKRRSRPLILQDS